MGGKLKSKKYLFFFLLTFKKELELRCSTQYKSETKGSYHNTLLISNIILHQVLRNKSSAWTKRSGSKIRHSAETINVRAGINVQVQATHEVMGNP